MERKVNEVPATSVVLSYARADSEDANALEQGLHARSISVCRDKAGLQAGEKWPKQLGEAIQRTSALILLWSEAASSSDSVELEWNIALALGKPILPVLSDETPLPVALRATQVVQEREVTRTVERVLEALEACGSAQPGSASAQGAIIGQLESLASRDPHDVLNSMRLYVKQAGWAVTGPTAQTGSDIYIRGRDSGTRTLADRLRVWVAIIVGLFAAATFVEWFNQVR